MRSKLVPNDFIVPTGGTAGSYTLHPVTTADAVEDWLAVTSNAAAIVRQREARTYEGWPFQCTLEENYKDVAWLELCAFYRQLFSYILRNDDKTYAGMVYVYPIELQLPDHADKYNVDFSFWITQSEENAGHYPIAYEALSEWLYQNWPFKPEEVFIRNPKQLPVD